MAVQTEQAVQEAVTRALEAELGSHGLLLSAEALAAEEAEAAGEGARLLGEAMKRAYGPEVEVAFEGGTAGRLAAALAFGAVSARVLAHAPSRNVELLCALFNLGIGLVDNVCDEDAEAGAALLQLVRRHDLVGASAEPRARGWLRGGAAARDHTAAGTVQVIETFFQLLHEVFPADEWAPHRRLVGAQLEAALAAEYRTVTQPHAGDVAELVECSRLTSVLPFEIVETISGGEGAGTLLGEAMWRIDDLVDLAQDARSGSLNGVLLQAGSLERVLSSGQVERAAAEAVRYLDTALRPARDRARRSFLSFVQRYAGI